MPRSVVVVGTGFKGFCTALQLLRKADVEITMIDAAPFFGGIMHSRPALGFNVDNGVQMFDSVPQELASIVDEIMSGETVEIDFVSESAFNGVVTSGFALPDLSSLDRETRDKITGELVALAAHGPDDRTPASLAQLFERRYGATAGAIFGRIFERIYAIDPADAEPSALAKTSLGRLKHLDDAQMLVLKQHPWLDTVLAARRRAVGKVDDFVSVYPVGGMSVFCDRARAWLEAKGVVIHLAEPPLAAEAKAGCVALRTNKRVIEADQVIWTNDSVEALTAVAGLDSAVAAYQHGAPMVLIAVCTDRDSIKDFTYLQSFEPTAATSRIAAAGLYSGQVQDGLSFITAECPAVPGEPNWESAESWAVDVWAECKSYGIVAQDAELRGVNVTRIKSAMRIPKVGFSDAMSELRAELAKKNDRIVLPSLETFSRRQIYFDIAGLVEH